MPVNFNVPNQIHSPWARFDVGALRNRPESTLFAGGEARSTGAHMSSAQRVAEIRMVNTVRGDEPRAPRHLVAAHGVEVDNLDVPPSCHGREASLHRTISFALVQPRRHGEVGQHTTTTAFVWRVGALKNVSIFRAYLATSCDRR